MTASQAALERRYRRLLGCYPPRHRRVHEREMLDVLMSGARDGQLVPGLLESASLLWGAARIWVRRRPGAGAPAWRDALALVSVAAPVLMAVTMMTAQLAAGFAVNLGTPWFRGVGPALGTALAGLIGDAPVLALAALAVALLFRLRRTALVLTAAALLAELRGAGWLSFAPWSSPGSAWNLAESSLAAPVQVAIVACCLLELGALLAAPGLQRGRELLTWRRAGWVIAGALLLGLSLGVDTLTPPAGAAFTVIVAAQVSCAAALAGRLGRSPSGRRLALLFLPVVYPLVFRITGLSNHLFTFRTLEVGRSVSTFQTIYQPGWMAALYLPLLAAVLLAAAWARRDRRSAGARA